MTAEGLLEGVLDRRRAPTETDEATALRVMEEDAEPFGAIEDADLDGLLDRIGDARIVLLGEATHGTSEFYRMRARMTRELIRRKGKARTGFHGLDLYSLYRSIHEVLEYLDETHPDVAELARDHDEAFFDAVQNARLVADAETYYRTMYYGSSASWNLRDQHMFDTLEALLAFRGPDAKAVVWEHNSHVGDASATEMGQRGRHNVGQLCRAARGDETYIVAFGTGSGTVAAASSWDGVPETYPFGV